MKKKKTIPMLVIISMLLSAAAILVPITTAANPWTVRGYVYVDGVITEPTDVILSIAGDEIHALNIYSDGYYEINGEGELGETGTFTVIYSGTLYTAAETVLITSEVLYKINLTVDTTANIPPYEPSSPSPTGSGVNIEADLSWSCTDPNGDPLTYDVYFGTDTNPPLVKSGHTDTTYTLATLSYSTSYNWKIVAHDNNGGTTVGPIWSFTTKSETPAEYCGDGTCNNGETCSSCPQDCGECPPPPPPNDPPYNPPYNPPTTSAPIADAGGDDDKYYGVVNEEITFDGSGSSYSDGTITNYRWDFDNDGTYDTDWLNTSTTTHAYTTADLYTVKLEVKADDGKTATDTAEVIVSQLNNDPTDPIVTPAVTDGVADTDYTFTAVSTDADNDTIKYVFNWSDGTNDTETAFTANNTEATADHNWSTDGYYILEVYAEDINGGVSGITKVLVLINVTYEEQENGTYYINNDGEEGWDIVYDPETGDIEDYVEPTPDEPDEPTTDDGAEPESDNILIYLIIIIVIILLLLLIVFGKRKKDKSKKKTETKKKTKK